MKTTITMFILMIMALVAGCRRNHDHAGQSTGAQQKEIIVTMKDGTRLSYFIEGEGYPCIVVTEGKLLHNTISQELKKNFKFIFINGRMNVPEPGDISKITFDVLVDDVEQIRKAVGLDRVSVFGHSVSGLIALEYARKYPQFATHVIMNGTPPVSGERIAPVCSTYWHKMASIERIQAWNNNWSGLSRDSLERMATSEAGKQIYILDGPQCFFNYDLKATSLLRDVYWNMNVWDRIFKELIMDYDIGKGIPIRTPVFLSLGKYDFYVPETVWEDHKGNIANLTCCLFTKSGHYSFIEEEDLYRKELMKWFEKTSQVK